MNRCLILIGNEGKHSNGSFLPGVSKDLESYENFFRSDNGGAWGSSEIAPVAQVGLPWVCITNYSLAE